MEGTSLTPQQEKLKALQELLPEAFSEGKIDWEKLKATLGEDINFSNERYVLNWAGKSDAFKVLQTPTTKTLVPAKDESINFDTTENIFIEGENLEVLKVLQKSYFGKVKMIYIDPPYNTGNDSFIYPDKFSETKAEYEKRVGDKDEEGYMTKDGMFKKNSKENGQYHSNWLSMMMPRLYLAKNLLRQDGVLFASIDDNEVHNLRLLLGEVFGEENFVGELIWKSRQNKDNRNINGLSIDHEYILCFSKNSNNRILKGSERKIEQYQNPDNDERGLWVSGNMVGLLSEDLRPNCHYDLINLATEINYGKPKMGWRYDKKTMARLISENRILWPTNNDGRPRRKVFLNEINEELPNFTSIVGQNIYTRNGTADIEKLFQSKFFDFPKPVNLIKEILEQATEENEIILDFFAGSGTTAQAVMELNKFDGGNRKFICTQLPEPCDEKSEAFKAGYKTIAEISKERIRRASKKIETELEAEKEKLKNQIEFEAPKENNLDLGFKVLKLADSNFKQWQQIEGKDAKALTEQMQLFIDPVSENATIENMVYEFLLKSGKDLNSKIEKRNEFFVINNSEMIMLLESVSQTIIEQVIAEKPMKVIALDKLFKDNDQLKTNTVLQMRDACIEFKTI
ncbi:MAG: site-specific DNA-methyltransferase [Saprospiraceae bacterium]|nr:site-specific DNA-methyltransferase [Saprospiraceae bacterium]